MIPSELLILQNEQQVGPFPAAAVQEMLKAGSLSPQDLAWGEGLAEWVTLESLFPLPVTAPAPTVGLPLSSDGPRSFGSFVADAFSYPFRGDGLIILSTGTLFFSVIEWVPKIGLLGSAFSICAWGYLLLMLQSVIHGTAQGEETLPRWPAFNGKGELVEKWFQWLIVVGFCFGPGILAEIWLPRTADDETPLLAWGLYFGGAGYFPMAMLGVAMFDSLAALNPLLIVRAIWATPSHYLLTLMVFAGLAAVKFFTGQLSDTIPYAGALIDQFDALWSAVFLARVLGGLYYVNRHRLGWF
jgi:hypothetical protein